MDALLLGLSIGLGAGVSPGPLLTLVLTGTLERGFGAGLRVASAPLITDLPIVIVCLTVLTRLPEGFLTILTLISGLLVIYLGLETAWSARRPRLSEEPEPGALRRDLWRGVLVNALSPHPWISWLGILGPQVVMLWRERPPFFAIGFVVLFYAGLVGSKIAIAWAVARGRHKLDGRWYRVILVTCGFLLVVLGAALLAQGALALD